MPGALELKVGVAVLALLGAEILKVFGTVVGAAQLILVVHARAVLAAVGRTAGRKRRERSHYETKDKAGRCTTAFIGTQGTL